MLKKVNSYINKYNLLNKDKKIVLAFSYGIDSTVCLDILLKLGYNVILAHVNHKHRAQSELEEQCAIKLAKDKNIPIEVLHLHEDFSKNFHDDAHNKRYEFFLNTARKYNAKYIVTAHHKNDNAENIILSLIKGSNLYGYSGIANMSYKDEIIISRPLLCLTKAEIKQYQMENNITYFEDESNSEDEFTRNRIRHHIIPLLEQENPKILDSMQNYSTQIKDAFTFIRGLAVEYLASWKNKINIKEYEALPTAVRMDILSLYTENNSIERSFNLLSNIDQNLLSNKSQLDIKLQGNYILKKRFNDAYIDTENQKIDFISYLDENNDVYYNKTHFYLTKILPTNNAKYIKLCYNELEYPLILRTRKNGDFINMSYGRKKIKDLLMDYHLTKEEKDEVLLLENKGDIIWVCNYAKSKQLTDMKDKANIYLVYEVQNEK